MIVLETTSYPIERLDFPTITLCPKSSNTDRWGIVIKLFDFLKMHCEKGYVSSIYIMNCWTSCGLSVYTITEKKKTSLFCIKGAALPTKNYILVLNTGLAISFQPI